MLPKLAVKLNAKVKQHGSEKHGNELCVSTVAAERGHAKLSSCTRVSRHARNTRRLSTIPIGNLQ